MKYRVCELIGENCLSQQAGQQIYDLIYPQLKSGNSTAGQQTYDNVIENAKHYYSDAQYRKVVDEMIAEESLCL